MSMPECKEAHAEPLRSTAAAPSTGAPEQAAASAEAPRGGRSRGEQEIQDEFKKLLGRLDKFHARLARLGTAVSALPCAECDDGACCCHRDGSRENGACCCCRDGCREDTPCQREGGAQPQTEPCIAPLKASLLSSLDEAAADRILAAYGERLDPATPLAGKLEVIRQRWTEG